MTTASIGQEGFVWFIGKVEDRDDPLQLGRVKVRIMDFHPESKSLVPTDQLPWAQILLPSTNPSFEKVGLSPVGLTIGTTVFGFFIDGYDANQPVILGTTHGKVGNVSDVPDTSIGLNSVPKSFDSFEPTSAYAAQYPYNKTFRSEQGHVIEIDDTPNQERIHMYHKSGTYKEINKNGNQVDKIVGDHFEITLKNKVVHIKGDVAMLVDGTYTLESKGNMLFKAPRIDINPPGDSGVASKATGLASEASAQAATGTQTTTVSSTAGIIEGSDATSDSVIGETGSDLGAQIAALFTSGTILGLIAQAVEPMVAEEMKALGTFNVGEGNTVTITASGGIAVQDLTINSTSIAVPSDMSVGNSTVNASINSTSLAIGGIRGTNSSNNDIEINANGIVIINGLLETKGVLEKIDTITGATGTVVHDLDAAAVFYHTTPAANFTANFTNTPTTNDRAISVALVVNQGSTAYIPTGVEINGASQTLNWQDGFVPPGTASSTDVVSFTFIRTGSAWTVLGTVASYS